MTKTGEKVSRLDTIKEISKILLEKLSALKTEASTELVIDESGIDDAVLKTPKLLTKYSGMLADESIGLDTMMSNRTKIKLERWKYWMGKQTDKYYADNGIVHEKILKTDVDKYLDADPVIIAINETVSIQRQICEYLERVIKEINSRNFHCRVVVDWRKFVSGN